MKTKEHKSSGKKNNNPTFFNAQKGTGFFGVQPKLNVGKPGDKYEQEADRVADQVVQNSNDNQGFFGNSGFFGRNNSTNIQEKPLAETISPLIQRQEEEEEAQPKLIQLQEEEEEMMQMQPMEEEEEAIQAQSDVAENSVSDSVVEQLGNKTEIGQKLDPKTKAEMESSFGTDLSSVSIHTGSNAVHMNQSLGAQAFTHGNNIYFNNGKYSPQSRQGKHLLAHEVTHTIQQRGSVLNGKIQRWPWSLSLEDQKRLFRSRTYGPITYSRGGSGAGFDASYYPMRSRLNVEVRGKVRFADTLIPSGNTYTSPNFFMQRDSGFIPILRNLPSEVQARILPYFQWTEREKRIHLIRFMNTVNAASDLWQNTGMSFQINETGWEDITATPSVNVDITEGDAVHATEAVNLWGSTFRFTNTASSDHLQVEIVKQPSVTDFREVKRIITEHNAARGTAIRERMVRGVRSYQGNDPGSRNSAPAGFNNLMSLRSNATDAPGNMEFEETVMFAHNEDTLSEDGRRILDEFFSNSLILLENDGRDIDITLSGYASAPGSARYNTSLVERRIDSVEQYINEIASRSDINANISNSIWRSNNADESAEEDLATNPEAHDPASFRKVDIHILRVGRSGQNTFAHELGHVFGLGDEYVSSSRTVGSAARHDPLARAAGVTGGSRVANDNRIMSGGNQVGAAHYSTFADALNRLTSKRWKIVT